MAKRSKKRSKKKSKRRKNPKRVKAGKKAARKRKRGSKRKKKNKSTKPRKKPMAKGLSSKLKSPLLKKILMAAGAVTIATSVVSLILPNQAQLLNSPFVKAALGFAVGDIPGAATNFLLAGGVGNLSGNGNAANVNQAGNTGFA